jgi:anti-sigma factor RsiW
MTTHAEALSCQELTELITAYLEGTLAAADRQRFEAHLAMCQGCTNYLEQMRTTIALVGRLAEDTISPAAKDALLETFRGWKHG